MFSIFLMMFAVGQSVLGADYSQGGMEGKESSSRRTGGLSRDVLAILNDEDFEGSDEDAVFIPSYGESDGKFKDQGGKDRTSMPRAVSRLEMQINRDRSDGDSSEDDEYTRYMEEEVMPALREDYELTRPGHLYSYIAKELHQLKGIREEDFRSWQVSVGDILSSLEQNICDSVRNFRELLQDHEKGSPGDYERLVMKLAKTRRAGMDLLNPRSDFLVNCKALIFKFYAKELFSRLIQISCDSKTYEDFLRSGEHPDLTSLSENKHYKEVAYGDLDTWFNFNEKVMITFEAFMNDLCSLKYGGINDIKLRLKEVAIPQLMNYLEINLIFLTTWYEQKRSGFSMALSAWGAKTSHTQTIYNKFVDEFKKRFCSSKFGDLQITLDSEQVNLLATKYSEKFGKTDKDFNQGITSKISTVSSWVPTSWWGSK